MRSKILAIAILSLVAMFNMPWSVALAHHSNAEYGDKLTKMNGTVVEYRWRNPHVTVVWDAKDANGKVVRWRGELASIGSVMGHGLTRSSLKPGDEIQITVFPSKLGTPESVIVDILRPDGTVVLGWGQQGGASRKAAQILDEKPAK
jgi:Family of unknown function (DUF6152)